MYHTSKLLLIVESLRLLLSSQIWTSRQVAVQVVHAYPYILDKPRLLDVLAAHRGQVHMQIAPEVDSLQHAANWQQVEDYLHRFTPVDLHRHVPFT